VLHQLPPGEHRAKALALCVKACQDAAQLDEVEQLLLSAGLHAGESVPLAALIREWCRVGDVKRAAGLCQWMASHFDEQAATHSFAEVAIAEAKAGRLEKGLEHIHKAFQYGSPRHGIVRRFVVLAALSEDSDIAMVSIQLMLDNGIQPKGTVCTALVQNSDTAYTLERRLEQIEGWKCNMNRNLALSVVKAFTQFGELERAHQGQNSLSVPFLLSFPLTRFFSELQRFHIAPSSTVGSDSYITLMNAALDLGRPRYAVNVWLEMRRQFYGNSNSRLPSLVVRALGELGQVDALLVLHRSGFEQVHSLPLTRRIVLALGRAGAMTEAKQVSSSLASEPHSMLITIAHAHALCGDLEGSFSVANEIRSQGLRLTTAWAAAVITGVRTRSTQMTSLQWL